MLLLCADVALLVRPIRSSDVLRGGAVIGFAAAILWSITFLGWRWHQVRGRRGVLRGILGWTTVALLCVWMVLLTVSFPKYREAHLDNAYGVGALSFAGGAGLTYLIVIAPALSRARREELGYQSAEPTGSKLSGSRDHRASVCYMYDHSGKVPGYYAAVCSCGWSSDLIDAPTFPDHDAEVRVRAAALAHDPSAETQVRFPQDDPRH